MVIRQMVFSSERAACPRTPSPHPPHTATVTSCRRMDLALRLLRGDPDSASDPVTRISCSTPDSPGHKRAGPRGEGLPASDWVGVPEARLRTCEHDFSRPAGPRPDETLGPSPAFLVLSCAERASVGWICCTDRHETCRTWSHSPLLPGSQVSCTTRSATKCTRRSEAANKKIKV